MYLFYFFIYFFYHCTLSYFRIFWISIIYILSDSPNLNHIQFIIWSTTAWSGPPSPTRYTSSKRRLINWPIELNTKNSTKRQQSYHLVEFLVFNSIGQLISPPFDEVYRVGDGGPDHAVVLHMYPVVAISIRLNPP